MKSFVFSLLLIALLLLINSRSSLCADTVEYTNCSRPVTCGTVKNISYPFWGETRAQYCGVTGFEVTCEENVPLITMRDIKFRILEMPSTTATPTVKVARDDYWGNVCPSTPVTTNLNFSLFTYSSSGQKNVSLYYQCQRETFLGAPTNLPNNMSYACNDNDTIYYLTQTASITPLTTGFCTKEVFIPVFESTIEALEKNSTDIVTAIDSGFNLDVLNADTSVCNNCEASGGFCGQNLTTGAFMCYCSNSSSTKICDPNSVAPPGAPPSGSGILNCPVYRYAYNKLLHNIDTCVDIEIRCENCC